MGTANVSTDAVSELLGAEQTGGLDDGRLLWTHLGSIGLSQGLLTGR